LIPEIDIFKPAEHRIIHFPEERAKIFEFFREALERKYEGLIIKGSNDLYFTNESRSHWKKLKRGFANNRDSKISKIELDLIVMGANRGQGSKNSKSFTSYLLGT
jgi:ATP-dependent DNA ligase